jgi:dTDP-4-amino-4,6-dideoxygalactose transaminase
MQPKIWLSPPHMGTSEKKYVDEAFRDNWIAPVGPNIDGFEKDIESYLGEGKHVAALSSGTAAIHLALIMLGVGRGDEVICQSLTFSASANPIVYTGATPVFVDSEPDSWNMCPDALEEAIKDRLKKNKTVKAIIAVHIYGMPCKIEGIQKVASVYGIPIVEDAAEAMGSSYNGKLCGSFGQFGIFSFNGNKIITTSGGGALVTANATNKSRAVYLATQAKENKPYYHHTETGYNYRMSNICAGIGRGQMEVLEGHVNSRRQVHAFYAALFKDSDVKLQQEYTEGCFSNYWLTAICVGKNASFSADDMYKALMQNNIESRPLWKPLHLQPVFKDAPHYDTGISAGLFNAGLCLPSGSGLGENEKERIYKVLKSIL